jgi:hypothetical protein
MTTNDSSEHQNPWRTFGNVVQGQPPRKYSCERSDSSFEETWQPYVTLTRQKIVEYGLISYRLIYSLFSYIHQLLARLLGPYYWAMRKPVMSLTEDGNKHDTGWWLSSSGRCRRVALIRTDVSEDRIASIFRVHECEQVTERSCNLLYRQRLVGYCAKRLRGKTVQTLEDGGDTIPRNVGSYKSYTATSPRRW